MRRSAACAHLNRDQISIVLATTAELYAERKRILTMLERIPPSFGEVRKLLNELTTTLRPLPQGRTPK